MENAEMQVQNNTTQAFELLKMSYLGKLLDRMIVIENASLLLSDNPNDPDALSALKRECHKLSGISQSLGFKTIGELATEIDCAIALKNAPWQNLKPTVERLLDNMEAELE